MDVVGICDICGGTLIYDFTLNYIYCDTCDYQSGTVL